MTKTEPVQQLSDASLMQVHAEPAGDPLVQVSAPEPRDTVAGQVGTAIDPGRNLGPLRGRQMGGTVTAGTL